MELLTRHATARMQQRGIRAQALEALLDFGRERHIHFRGREIVYFDKKARARLARSRAVAPRSSAVAPRSRAVAPAKAGAERFSRTYAILGSDGTVITVGHRFRRIPRS